MAGNNEKSDEEQLQDLEVALKTVPGDMYTFGLGLRKLFNELQVTGNDEATKKFLSVRDKTREQAVIYVKEVLPSSEEAVKAISALMDTYTDLDKDEWLESLDEILEELEDAHAVCKLLRQMHNDIIVELYKNSDEAKVGIELLTELSQEYEREKARLLEEARQHSESAEYARFFGVQLAPVTLGVSALIGGSVASARDRDSRSKTSQAVAKAKNADIATQAAMLTTTTLIPAIESFTRGLDVCVMFIKDMQGKLEKMKNAGGKLKDKPKAKLHYNTMRNRAPEIIKVCDFFVSVTDRMKNNLEAIPKQPNDQNFVDQWLDQQMLKFKEEHKEEGLRRIFKGSLLKSMVQSARKALDN